MIDKRALWFLFILLIGIVLSIGVLLTVTG
jgi:LPS O-antigen subunit length determinant protein (WzzB/FepE family)